MSVAETFGAFRRRYLIPTDAAGSISYRYRRITRQLNRDFWNTESEHAHSLYVGSYGRDTAAKGISDIDVAFTLPSALYFQYNAHVWNGQSALLQAVKTSIGRTYSSSHVGADGQVIAVNFQDGVRFEFLPVFTNTLSKFTFADANAGGCWRECDPRAEMAAFAAKNSATNGNLKAIARMVRIWRDYHGVVISGMLIDTLAYRFIENWPFRDKSYLYHDWLVRDFLFFLASVDRSQTYWRAPGSAAHVYKTGAFRGPAAAAYQTALAAVDHEANHRPSTARNKWRELFGPTYP